MQVAEFTNKLFAVGEAHAEIKGTQHQNFYSFLSAHGSSSVISYFILKQLFKASCYDNRIGFHNRKLNKRYYE